MQRDWLATRLEAGRSIESIAREADKSPSTVAYWVNKHGLVSRHAGKHAARGGVDRDELQSLVEEGRSIRQIAATLDLSAATVRHWLRKHGLKTQPASRVGAGDPERTAALRSCSRHGWTVFVRIGPGRFRCGRCNSEAVSERRRRAKARLVTEFGGCCARCGYDEYAGALQFHHLDPSIKSFELGGRGLTRSLDLLRQEARKCVLLCANCHAMIGAGVATLPQALPSPGNSSGA